MNRTTVCPDMYTYIYTYINTNRTIILLDQKCLKPSMICCKDKCSVRMRLEERLHPLSGYKLADLIQIHCQTLPLLRLLTLCILLMMCKLPPGIIFLDLLYPFSHAFFRTSLFIFRMHIESRFCNPHVEILPN
jgi:hypothetical protein